jgi:hypothetical protein
MMSYTPFILLHLFQKCFAICHNVGTFMPIVVNSFLYILTQIAQLMQPIDSCPLADAAVWACQTQCGNNHLVDVMAQLMGSDGAEILGSKITAHSMKYIFIVQESVLTMTLSCGKKVITSRISGPDKYRRVVLVVRWGVFSPIVGI